ncbi:MAG: hypothetical protein ACRDH7_01970 [Actinomycetota bacterium]
MSESEGSDMPFEEFEFAQAGACAHVETMAQAARDAAEDALAHDERAHAQRLSQVAEQADAIRVLIEMLDMPPE